MNSRQIAITTLPKNRVQQTTSPNGKAGALATAMRLFRNRKETPTIEKADPDIPQPLSYAQELLWLFQQINPESTVYNRVHAFRLQGTLNISALEKAINEIMRRHTILRTTYHLADDQPIQRVLPHRAEQLEVMDLRGSAMETARDRYLPYLQAQMTQPFDISQEKICRFQLLQMAEEDFILVFCVHHIGYDVSSERVLFRELGILYEAFCLNKPSPLPELAIQYSDYAAWQRQSLNDVLLLEKLDFHQQLLDSELPLLELPSDMPRLNEVDTQGKTHIIPLDPELSQALRRLSQNEGVSFFDTMLTVFYVLLYRYTYQEKVVVGTPVTNRNQADLHKLLGVFVNEIALSVDLSDNPTFSDLLQRVQNRSAEALTHPDVPFHKLFQHLQAAQDDAPTNTENPNGFQALFNMPGKRNELNLYGLTVERLTFKAIDTQADFSLSVRQGRQGTELHFTYRAQLFSEPRIAQMATHYEKLLQSVTENPVQPIAQLPMLTDVERHQLLVEWNDTTTDYAKDKCVHLLFEEQVALAPYAVALVFEGEQLTYQELNKRANQLAHHLIAYGVGSRNSEYCEDISGTGGEKIVALLARRGPDFLIAMLAIFKAGGIYLPLDPRNPTDRHRQMLEQCRNPLILAADEFIPGLGCLVSSATSSQILSLGSSLIQTYSDKNLAACSRPSDLAYILFTSGSTGLPKGAMIEHQGMLNHLYAKISDLELSATDRIAQTASQSFDISIWQFLAGLLVGSTVHIYGDDTALDPPYLLKQIELDQISIWETVPSLMQALMGAVDQQPLHPLSALRWLIPTGEALSPQLANQWLSIYPRVPLLNAYGPTECSDDVTHYVIDQPLPSGTTQTPIGHPVINIQAYILDAAMQPTPVGVSGELWIGGIGVGRGYLNDPDRTAAVFVPNPFSDVPNAKLYKTGDLCRWLPDGNIEFRGRTDFQVKLRGFRIELGEIESMLLSHEGVREAVVVARDDRRGDKQLLAYMVQSGKVESIDKTSASLDPLGASTLRSFLQERLPDYMIPSAFVWLETMPLTPNGKIDRKALPTPDLTDLSTATFVAPRTGTEGTLAAIWCEVLGVGQVGVYDDFFHLGGHSLLAMQVVSRIRAAFEVEFPLHALFAKPTLGELSAEVDSLRQQEQADLGEPLVPVSRTESLALSYAQERLWFLDQLAGPSATYNMSMALRLRGQLNVAALEASLQAIVSRHESLRTLFVATDGNPIQVIQERTLTLSRIDLSALEGETQVAEVRRLQRDEAAKPFDLSQDLMLRATLLDLGEVNESVVNEQVPIPTDQLVANNEPSSCHPIILSSCHVLLLTMHHIASDGWSMGIFRRELSALYAAFSQGEPSPLPPLPIQYADFAAWQHQWLADEQVAQQLAYWKEQLGGELPTLDLPLDFPRPAQQTFDGARTTLQLSPEVSQQLIVLSQQKGSTLFMTLLAAFNLLLARLSGQEDILVGTPIAGRNQLETENLIGFFISTLVLRTDISGNPTFEELLSRVKQTTLDAYSHQDIPFEKLIQALQPKRDLSRSPLFQVWFNMLTERQMTHSPDLLITEPLERENDVTAKFDLTLYVRDTQSGIRFNAVYNTHLFTQARIENMLSLFEQILKKIVEDASAPIAALVPFVTVPHIGPRSSFEPVPVSATDCSIAARFEAKAAQYPNHIAIETAIHQWSYAELNARANQIAHALRAKNATPGRIGLLFEHDAPMIAAILGVLKAGKLYVPLDPTYPQSRLTYILEDAQVEGLVTNTQNMAYACRLAEEGVPLLNVDELMDSVPSDNLNINITPDALAYILYTSGSTGEPKGVIQNQRNVLHFNRIYTNNLHISAQDRLTLLSSYSFDAAVMAIYGALLNGATLCPYDLKIRGVEELADWLQSEAITIYHSTPTVYRHFIQTLTPALSFPNVRLVVMGGEALYNTDVEAYKRHFPQECLLINGLGPSESTVTLQYFIDHQTKLTRSGVPVGYPVDQTEILLLDESGEETGFSGEIAFRSPYLALGYWRNEEATSAAFLLDSTEPAMRIYRTGDLGRYLSDGSLEFLGRTDFQVKLRGFRIELGEVENALISHEGVHEAVVVMREDGRGDKQLVAYVVQSGKGSKEQGEEVDSATLRSCLREKLPDYMIPSAFVLLDALPLTPNGKLDRKALPAPDLTDLSTTTFIAPRTLTEQKLADVWMDVLGLEQIGLQDNFFEIGGHSLLAIQLISKAQRHFGVDFPVAMLFQFPTLGQMATQLQQLDRPQVWTPMVAMQLAGNRPPFFCVHGVGGNVHRLYPLSQALGPEQPFYGLQAVGVDGTSSPLNSVEAMATHYLEAIQTVQPIGPYYLAGYSFGCQVAFEMASQLQAQGCEVGRLILLDGGAPAQAIASDGISPRHTIERVDWLLNNVRISAQLHENSLPEIDEEALRQLDEDDQLQLINQHLQQAGLPTLDNTLLANFAVFKANMEMVYTPDQIIDVPTTLLYTAKDDAAVQERWESDTTMGWGRFIKQPVACHLVPGRHYSMMRKPYVEQMAKILASILVE